LAAHKVHDPSIQVIHVYYTTEVVTPKLVVQLPTELKTVLGIISASSHFAFFTMNFQEKEILIFDGLGFRLNCWIPHALNLFKKCGLLDLDGFTHFRCPKQGDNVIEKILRAKVKDGSTWSLKAGPLFFKQTDGHNCGPLASLKMMEVFGRCDRKVVLRQGATTIDPQLLRDLVVIDFQRLLKEFSGDLNVLKRKKYVAVARAPNAKIQICHFCLCDISKQNPAITMTCCNKNSIHEMCVKRSS
jgi:hypothetical protein